MTRKKILILSPYPIYPPQTGGALRIYNLSKELSKLFDVTHFSQGVNKKMILDTLSGKQSLSHIIINKHYEIIQSYNLLYNVLLFITSRFNAQNVIASAALEIYQDFKLSRALKNVSIIQVEHPWQFYWAKKYSDKYHIPLVLSCHNIETNILKDTIPNYILKKYLIDYISKKEKNAYKLADNIVYLSNNEKEYFQPNGIQKKHIILPMWVNNNRFIIKRNERVKRYINILFVGSNWMPNVIAVKFIEKLAEVNISNKKIKFIIAGSVGENRNNKNNIAYTGKLKSLISIYKKADIFINPISIGSGVNFKVLEAMAASLPIISTPFGVRGIKIKNNINGIIADLPEFNNILNKLINDSELRLKIGKAARITAQNHYTKKKVLKKINQFYKQL